MLEQPFGFEKVPFIQAFSDLKKTKCEGKIQFFDKIY